MVLKKRDKRDDFTMEDNAGLNFILDGVVKQGSIPDQLNTGSGMAAYEVLRIIRGVPLFYQDHYDRMKSTFGSIGSQLEMTAQQLKRDIKLLLVTNGTDICNVKVVVFEKDGNQRQLLYISKSYYPSEEEADTGVKTGLFQRERNNPNAKLLNHEYKAAVNAKITEGGYFEVILVDSAGRITEGSKSNMFLVKNSNIFTAPGDFVLKGITRKYVFEACRNAGYEVIEQFVDADRLSQVDGAFLSGTSIKVLPIARIDNITLKSSANPVVAAVRREYNQLIEKYIDENVKIC